MRGGSEGQLVSPRVCEYGFTEKVDFEKCFPNLESGSNGGQNKVDHMLPLSMAKEICMIQRSDIGRQIRRYLIEVENAGNLQESRRNHHQRAWPILHGRLQAGSKCFYSIAADARVQGSA